MKLFKIATLSTALMALPLAAAADVPNTFQAGHPASAAEVNENFSALEQRISDLEARVGTTLSMETISGDYRLQISGGLWEFFNDLDDPQVTESTAFRDFLVSGTMTLNSDGTMFYNIDGALEPGIFLIQGGGFTDDTFGNDEDVEGTWTLDTTNNIVSVTITDNDDPFALDLHIARDQNSLLGSAFVEETEEDGNEDITIWEVINLNAIRLP